MFLLLFPFYHLLLELFNQLSNLVLAAAAVGGCAGRFLDSLKRGVSRFNRSLDIAYRDIAAEAYSFG